jgi:hypothetical protein
MRPCSTHSTRFLGTCCRWRSRPNCEFSRRCGRLRSDGSRVRVVSRSLGTQDNGGITRNSPSGSQKTQASSPSKRDPTMNVERTSSSTRPSSVVWRLPRTLRYSTTCWKIDRLSSRHQRCCSKCNKGRTNLKVNNRRSRHLNRRISSSRGRGRGRPKREGNKRRKRNDDLRG